MGFVVRMLSHGRPTSAEVRDAARMVESKRYAGWQKEDRLNRLQEGATVFGMKNRRNGRCDRVGIGREEVPPAQERSKREALNAKKKHKWEQRKGGHVSSGRDQENQFGVEIVRNKKPKKHGGCYQQRNGGGEGGPLSSMPLLQVRTTTAVVAVPPAKLRPRTVRGTNQAVRRDKAV